jgi:hypothetical protein
MQYFWPFLYTFMFTLGLAMLAGLVLAMHGEPTVYWLYHDILGVL